MSQIQQEIKCHHQSLLLRIRIYQDYLNLLHIEVWNFNHLLMKIELNKLHKEVQNI